MKIRLRTCITLLIKRIHVAYSVNFMFYNINLNSYITQSALIEFPAHASLLFGHCQNNHFSFRRGHKYKLLLLHAA